MPGGGRGDLARRSGRYLPALELASGVRTRLDSDARQMWFILESLPEMPLAALQEAGARLVDGLRRMMPDARIEQSLVGFELP